MTTWSSSLLTRVEKHLHTSDYWGKVCEIDSRPSKRQNSIHLAVFVEPFLQFVLDGRKTVESRFSIHRRPPFGCVRSGDLVLIKESGGPVVAMAEVSNVWYYQLDPALGISSVTASPSSCVWTIPSSGRAKHLPTSPRSCSLLVSTNSIL